MSSLEKITVQLTSGKKIKLNEEEAIELLYFLEGILGGEIEIEFAQDFDVDEADKIH